MINGISSTSALAGRLGGASADRGIAAAVVSEMGNRAAAWVATLGGGGAGQGGFQPDAQLLARGGDVYGVGDVARDVAARLGAGPAEEGALHRAIADFTREAVVTSAVFADTPAVAQERIGAALPEGVAGQAETVDGVIGQLEQATDALRR